jgi:aminoglycoside phosphotransferase (APT) family kinase protein
MSKTVQLDLPEDLAAEAQASGLLEPERIGELLNEELRRERARKKLGQMMADLHSVPGEPMSRGEIQMEIDEARAEQRNRESGR